MTTPRAPKSRLLGDPTEAPTPRSEATRDVAIIGMAIRVPGAMDYDTHWSDILGGHELLTRLVPADLQLAGVPEQLALQRSYRPVTSIVDHAGGLDAEFFGISPSEAAAMDPQHRVLLELCWSAMEDAGTTPEALGHRTGVYAGGGRHGYLRFLERGFADQDWLDGSIHGLQSDIGNYGDFLATRVSYRLGLTGPSLTVQTACSTGLMAVHLACRSIISGDCESALAGAVNIHTPQNGGYHYEDGSICSANGRLRPFDERADGSVFGNGAGMVLLKSLDAALRDGDRIVAVIKSSAANNDGRDKMSYTAPSVSGQAAVISDALRGAGVDPASVGYVEAHGTGTPLGDPIEIQALNRAFGQAGGPRTCGLGTAKSQIGHLGPAAGIIGLIRAALVVERGIIPKCVNFAEPSSRIAWSEGPFYVPTENTGWTGHRRAGVSAFGVGGTNVHAILEQAPLGLREDIAIERPVPIVLSAATPGQLREQQLALAKHLTGNPRTRIHDVAHTLARGRATERYRAFWSAQNTNELAGALRNKPSEGIQPEESSLRLVMAFPGQGDQYVRAAESLYDSDPLFATTLDESAKVMAQFTSFDIRDLMFANRSGLAVASARLHRAQRAQEALFVFEYSLGRTLIDAGLFPSVMIGHSAGEYAAATLSGILSLADAARLVAARGRLMEHHTPRGAMMAVGLAEDELSDILPADLDLAAVNAPGQCVVSGPYEAIAAFQATLERDNVLNFVLGTSVAAHSRLMDAARDEFGSIAADIEFGPATIPVASTLLGIADGSSSMRNAGYWTDHLRRPVRYMDAADDILRGGRAVILEVGPGRAASGMFRQLDAGINLPALSLWRRDQPEPRSVAEVVGRAWELGARIDWPRTLAGLDPRPVPLPGRAHRRKALWTTIDAESRDLPKLTEASWVWAPRWALAPTPMESPLPERVVVITAELEAAPQWVADLDVAVTVVATPATQPGDPPEFPEQTRAAIADADAFIFIAAPTDAGVSARDAMGRNFWPLLQTAMGISAARPTEPSKLLVVIPQGAVCPDPEQALITGPCHVLPQEYPNLQFAVLRGATITHEIVEDELGAFDPHADIIYRDGRRLRRIYQQIEAPLGPDPWRSGQTYLVTGGTGGIGLAVADAIATVDGAQVVLTRRPKQAGARDDTGLTKRLDSLREGGLQVHVVDVDVRDATGMRALRQQFGPFDGIVHAAGVAGGRLTSALTPDSVDAVVSPKVDGIRVVDQTVVDDQTRWVALCSSLSSRIGGIGHADYSSANAYLDAYAESTTEKATRYVSLGYDALIESGMAVDESRRTLLASHGGPAAARRGATTWRSHIDPDDWVLREHVVGGHHILAGTAIIELIHQSASDLLGADTIEIRGLDLLQPADSGSPSHPMAIEISYERAPSGWSVTVRCGTEPSGLQATATCTVSTESIAREPLPSVTPISSALAATATEDPFDRSTGLVNLGPRWDCRTQRLRLPEDDTVLATSTLRDEFTSDLRSHAFHPALLDNALGATLMDLDDHYLPYSYERIVVHAPLPAAVVSEARRTASAAGSVTLDVTCRAVDGTLLLTVEGYQLRRVTSEQLFDRRPAATNRSLGQSRAGDLESLRFAPASEPACGPDDVVVRVRASGLNFKEVLMASGLLDQPDNYRYGLEFAGTVTHVGHRVEDLHPDQAVFGFAESCFDDLVTAPARLIRPIPRGLTFEQAATIPVAFTTAYDCLVKLGQARAGDTVLIHAVAGGVGAAAAQIAKHLGLTVFGSAGNQHKREWALHELEVDEVYDSRNTDFEEQVTSRGGVDVVLNSLGGEYIEAGLRCLRSGGRFVEMGRRDIVASRPLSMSVFTRGITFAAYFPDIDTQRFADSLDAVVDLLRSGIIRPLPYRAFPTTSVIESFQHMARAEHIGKVLVVRDRSSHYVSGDGYSVNRGGITNDMCVSALKRALRLDAPSVLITARDINDARSGVVVADNVLGSAADARATSNPVELIGLEGDVERTVGEIWAGALRLDTVSRDDTFVGLGGDSLYATQVVSRIDKAFAVRIPPSDILTKTTLAELAAKVEALLDRGVQ